jgi:NitT/TauT family transport system permease protein
MLAALTAMSSKFKGFIFGEDFWRGIVSVVAFLVFWEAGSRSHAWFGFAFPWVSQVPAPTAVLREMFKLVQEPSFWNSAFLSTLRVFEVLRPIPPLAWVPASVIFWPTQELSIAFVTFLGAFFTIVINVIGGAQAIDVRYFQAARSMGSSTWDIFRRIILPGTLPSIVVGATVGIGITWAVVVAAEMISGGGSAGSVGGAAGGGLGFFIWNSYVGGSYTQIVAGMISIGIAGYISSAFLRKIGRWMTPWLSEN